ncbi:hypothetical protein LCGC14_1658850 [marine sediment metagenome]|uniref:Radical SAM core domain-containing protein n=1 Tax=marine sediment metagenome TaxID=412755 RepID=A0A0F9HUQ5_9ZZZZ
MSEIVLINPGATQAIYQGLSDEFTAIEPPTWVRMIAGWLRDRGYKIAIIDQEAEALGTDDILVRLEKMGNPLVAIIVSGHQPSASTQQMVGAHAVADAIGSQCLTIMIGNHPSALPKRTLAEEPVEFVCDGEGPITIAAILDGVSIADVPGLVWAVDPKIDCVCNPRAPLIPIDELHGDVWDLLPMDHYRAHNWQCFDGSPRQPYASIYTTLGCPFKCSFCMINVFQHINRYRMRTPDKVVAQVVQLYNDYGISTFKFADEMFVLNVGHYTAICEGLARLPFADELNIWAYARVDTIRSDTLALLRQAGIRWLCLGIESGSTHVRRGAKKPINNDDIINAVQAIQRADINVLGNFIFGLPDDTMESMQATFTLAESLKLEFVNFYSAMAYPGSRLFDEANSKDLPVSWSGYSQHSADTRPLPTATLLGAEVLEFRDRSFQKFFTNPIYLERINRKFGQIAVNEIIAMTAVDLPREKGTI